MDWTQIMGITPINQQIDSFDWSPLSDNIQKAQYQGAQNILIFMSDQEEVYEDFEEIEFTEEEIEQIRDKRREEIYPGFQQSHSSPKSTGNWQQETNNSPDIKVGEFEIKPSDIDLNNSFDKVDLEEKEGNGFMDSEGMIGFSIHMQNEESRINYLSGPFNEETGSIHEGSEKNSLDIQLEQSVHTFKKVKGQSSSSIKKESPQHETEEIRSQQGSALKREMSDSSNDIDLPLAGQLKLGRFSSSDSSAGSAGKTWPTDNEITQYQIVLEKRLIIFKSRSRTEFHKDASESYLDYIEKYFFYNFNIILPSHIPGILSSELGVKTYLSIYFDFIISRYSAHLYQFLLMSHYKESSSKIERSQPQSIIQSKLSEYTSLLVQKIYSGYDTMGEIVKKFKGGALTRMRALEVMFSKQALMAQKHYKARIKLESITKNSIKPNVYQMQGSEMREKQEYVLMCLRWLVGFQIAVEAMKEREQRADPVEKEKFQVLLNDFLQVKQKQEGAKTAILQQKIRSMYTLR